MPTDLKTSNGWEDEASTLIQQLRVTTTRLENLIEQERNRKKEKPNDNA